MKLKTIIISWGLLACPAFLNAQSLFVQDMTVAKGETIEMPVYMDNEGLTITSFDCKITMPEGATIATVNDRPLFTLTDRKVDHTIAGSILQNGDYKLIAYSPTNSVFAGESGAVFMASFTVDLDPGTYIITLKQITLTAMNPQNHCPEGYDCGTTCATLTVTGSGLEEQCAVPEISIDSNGNVFVSCQTEGAKLHTTIIADDHKTVHHDSMEPISLSGVYNVASYATADGMRDSEVATAKLAWTKNYDPTEVNGIGTERPLLVYNVGEYLYLKGTVRNEPVILFTSGGTLIFRGNATEDFFMIPSALTRGVVYIVTIGERNIKYTL